MTMCWIVLSPFYYFLETGVFGKSYFQMLIYKIYCGLWKQWVSDLQAHPFICYSMTRDSLKFVEEQGMGPFLLSSAQQMACACPWFNPLGLWVIALAARASNCNYSHPNYVTVIAKSLYSEMLSPSFAQAAVNITRA